MNVEVCLYSCVAILCLKPSRHRENIKSYINYKLDYYKNISYGNEFCVLK
jgi:hypothetical protein